MANARKPFERRLAAIEAELEPLAAESREAEAWLASPEAYEDASRERLQATLRRRGAASLPSGGLPNGTDPRVSSRPSSLPRWRMTTLTLRTSAPATP